MDRLDLIMQILNKVENEGYEPTEEEAKMIVEFLDDVAKVVKEVMKQFREMIIQMTEVINQWWNALPEETRVAIRELSGIPQPLPKGVNQVSAMGTGVFGQMPTIAYDGGTQVGMIGGDISMMINNPVATNANDIIRQRRQMLDN